MDEREFQARWGSPVLAEPHVSRNTLTGEEITTPPRCGRCKGTDGEIWTYPVGNFHEECAALEQADDEAYERAHKA